jgi:hypothetical protein
MVATLIVAGILLLVGIVTMIVLAVTRDSIKASLASFISIFSGLMAASHSPEVDAVGAFELNLGPFGHVTGQVTKIGTTRPVEFWIATYVVLAVLIIYTMSRIPSK